MEVCPQDNRKNKAYSIDGSLARNSVGEVPPISGKDLHYCRLQYSTTRPDTGPVLLLLQESLKTYPICSTEDHLQIRLN